LYDKEGIFEFISKSDFKGTTWLLEKMLMELRGALRGYANSLNLFLGET
jgi:hypothetical protein